MGIVFIKGRLGAGIAQAVGFLSCPPSKNKQMAFWHIVIRPLAHIRSTTSSFFGEVVLPVGQEVQGLLFFIFFVFLL